MRFPDDFLWGAATSSFQIEGAPAEDGKGESIWDRFTHKPGNVKDGATGDIACDHYHRYKEDLGLMKELGLRAYRFSISWPRIMPRGRGGVEQRGVDFYSRLVDELLDAGIQPFVTLYHWDLPQALQERGGWANRDIKGWFGDFAAAVAKALGDRVRYFATLNEPQIFATLGYLRGEHAPGIEDPLQYFKASHYINLAHANAVTAIREEAKDPLAGTVLQLPPVYPASDSGKDRDAARMIDGLLNRWYAQPVLAGGYPEDMLSVLGPLNLPIEEGDEEFINKPLDFVGLNIYTRVFACHDPEVPLLEANIEFKHKEPGARYTRMGWEVYPECIYESLMRIKEEWGDPEVYVTENGAALDDHVENGAVNDGERIDFYRAYLEQAHRAMQQGVKLKGYFAWSLMDNFEWAYGFTRRFGLIHVDFDTQKRTPKASAFWYRDTIANNGFEA